MNTLSTQFEHELAKLIQAKIEVIKDNLAAGTYTDPGEYKRYVGQIYAYRHVVEELAAEANKILTER